MMDDSPSRRKNEDKKDKNTEGQEATERTR